MLKDKRLPEPVEEVLEGKDYHKPWRTNTILIEDKKYLAKSKRNQMLNPMKSQKYAQNSYQDYVYGQMNNQKEINQVHNQNIRSGSNNQ